MRPIDGSTPLWRALCEAHPHSASPTHAPPLDDRPLPLRHAYRALYERVIDIHDGLRLARNHVNPAVVGLARQLALQAGCTAEMADIVAFGSGVAVWLDTRRHNAVRRFPNRVDVPAHHTGSGLRQQVRLLTAVAHAFSQAPLVRTDRYRSASVLRRLSLRTWSKLRHPTHVARAVVPSAGTTPTGGTVGPAVRHPDRQDAGGEPRP